MANDDVIERLSRFRRHRRTFDVGDRLSTADDLLDEMEDALRASRARVAEQAKDSERLDWLADCGCVLMWQDRDQEYLVVDAATRSVVSRAKTSRAAIDAALSAEDGREKEIQ